MDKAKIERINALARKAREEGLTPAEKDEQARLRADYIAAFRAGLKNTLEGVYVVDENGNEKKIERKA